jgi:hypothetical protein
MLPMVWNPEADAVKRLMSITGRVLNRAVQNKEFLPNDL